MEFRGCFICLEPCTSKKVEVVKDKELKPLQDNLNVFFILKTVLNIPNDVIEKMLKKFGNPEDWGIFACSTCKLTYLDR